MVTVPAIGRRRSVEQHLAAGGREGPRHPVGVAERDGSDRPSPGPAGSASRTTPARRRQSSRTWDTRALRESAGRRLGHAEDGPGPRRRAPARTGRYRNAPGRTGWPGATWRRRSWRRGGRAGGSRVRPVPPRRRRSGPAVRSCTGRRARPRRRSGSRSLRGAGRGARSTATARATAAPGSAPTRCIPVSTLTCTGKPTGTPRLEAAPRPEAAPAPAWPHRLAQRLQTRLRVHRRGQQTSHDLGHGRGFGLTEEQDRCGKHSP